MATEIIAWVIVGGVLLSLGCAGRTAAPSGPAQALCPEGVTTAQVVEAAHAVLAGMHFTIEKLDAEQGVVKTWPLRAGQFFEVWRSDNVGAFNTAEANFQSIRRTVDWGWADDRPGFGLRIECDVQVWSGAAGERDRRPVRPI